MAEKRKIVATTYTYKKNDDGKYQRIRKHKKTTDYTSFKELRSDLIDEAKGSNGKFLKLTHKYDTIKVATPQKIKSFNQIKSNGTLTRTFYSFEPKNKKENLRWWKQV